MAGILLGQVFAKPRMVSVSSDERAERYTYLGDKQAVLRLDLNAIRRHQWSAELPNPPVAARKAIEKATAAFKQMRQKDELLKDRGDGSWEIESVNLTPLDPGNDNRENKDCWYWLVRYELFGSIGGQPPQLEIAILMDGTVVRPAVREQE
ncbi:MAG: hypothetical protein ABFC96_18400 [Thermoguttaceae bacterium]